jgi:hypothetical protein
MLVDEELTCSYLSGAPFPELAGTTSWTMRATRHHCINEESDKFHCTFQIYLLICRHYILFSC